MQIIAYGADTASANPEKTLQIANDADIHALVASGALAGVELVELNFPKFTNGRAYTQAVLSGLAPWPAPIALQIALVCQALALPTPALACLEP